MPSSRPRKRASARPATFVSTSIAKTGEIRALANLLVAEKVTNPQDEISLNKARKIKPDAQVGEEVEVEVTPKNFGRIAAQTAKQAMMQRIRQVEKEMIYEEFKDRAGEIVSGTVRRFDRSDVILDLGKFEAIMPQRERVVIEDYNVGDRLRAYVVAVENGIRGPEIIISRSHPNFVRRLFELEVSEIADGTVEIRGIAREAGYRTKIAVFERERKSRSGRRLRRHARFAGEEHRPRTEQREGRYHPLELRPEGICPRSAQAREGEEPGLRSREKERPHLGRRRSALARDREKGPERAPDLAAHRLGDQHREGQRRRPRRSNKKWRKPRRPLPRALPITEEQAMTLVKSGFTNLEGLRDAEVQDLVDILGVDEAKAREIHEAVHREPVSP